MGFGAGSGAGAGLCFDTAACLQQFWYSSQKLVPFAQDIILILPLSQIAYIAGSETALNCPLAMSSPYQSHVMGFGVGEGFGCGAGDGFGAGAPRHRGFVPWHWVRSWSRGRFRCWSPRYLNRWLPRHWFGTRSRRRFRGRGRSRNFYFHGYPNNLLLWRWSWLWSWCWCWCWSHRFHGPWVHPSHHHHSPITSSSPWFHGTISSITSHRHTICSPIASSSPWFHRTISSIASHRHTICSTIATHHTIPTIHSFVSTVDHHVCHAVNRLFPRCCSHPIAVSVSTTSAITSVAISSPISVTTVTSIAYSYSV